MSRKTIILDPGHGLHKDGTFSRPLMDCRKDPVTIVPNSMKPGNVLADKYNTKDFYREDIGTLFLARAIREELKDKYNVLLTREDIYSADIHLSKGCTNKWKVEHWQPWKWIVDFTNKNNADIFISLHTNATDIGIGKGCSCFWESAPEGVNLAEYLTRELHAQLNIPIRKVAKHRYAMLKNNCKGKSVLLEVLFHNNFNEVKYLLTEEGNKKVAKVISEGIDKYISSLN